MWLYVLHGVSCILENALDITWVEPQSPTEIMDEAITKYDLDSLYVLYSGGKDSGCVVDWTAKNYPKMFKKGGAVFTNVGLGAQDTRKFVVEYCHRKNWKLTMTWPIEKDRFYHVVLRHGWANVRNHKYWMASLKYYNWRALMMEALDRGEKAAFISGVRKKESYARNRLKRFTKKPIDKDGRLIFIKPFLYKNGIQLWNYYNENTLEKSPVYTWLNRSGECYCGAFLAKWELKMIEKYDPFAFESIKWLENQIELYGTKEAKLYARYGGFNSTGDSENQTAIEDYCGESCIV